jgi:hypothetical protein
VCGGGGLIRYEYAYWGKTKHTSQKSEEGQLLKKNANKPTTGWAKVRFPTGSRDISLFHPDQPWDTHSLVSVPCVKAAGA